MGIRERKERDKQEMRELILKAAKKLFLKQGFENVSLRNIADEIEYSPATVYLYFKDKAEIFFALHKQGFDELDRRQLETASVKDPLKRLHKLGEVYIKFALENPEYYELMFIMRTTGKLIEECKEWDAGERAYNTLRQTVQACIDAGYLKGNVETASFAMWSLVHGIVSLDIRKRTAMFPPEHLNAMIHGTLGFFVGNLQQKK
jgi:AcrR family transcriptional regulator